jgi:hypothetical protein
VGTRETEHFLYSFQLAAVSGDVGTTFELLRTNVEVLSTPKPSKTTKKRKV